MKNIYARLFLESIAAAFFCGVFTVISGLLITWHQLKNMDAPTTFNPPLQYMLFSLALSTVSVFVPLLIFNFAKMKYIQRRTKK